MMEAELIELIEICDDIAKLEPYPVMAEIARLIQRNTAIGGIDLTVVVVPTSYPIRPYPHAKAVLADLTANYHDVQSIYDAHMTGIACVEVDELSGNNVDNGLKLYNNRGALHTDPQ